MTNPDFDFGELHRANIARQREWPGSAAVDPYFRALEAANEVGEVLGAIKKLIRSQRGIAGSTVTVDQVAEEIGDALISLSLLSQSVDGFLGVKAPSWASLVVADEHNAIERLALHMFAEAGDVALHMANYRSDCKLVLGMQDRIDRVTFFVFAIATALDIDPMAATAAKFNATSKELGLKTLMRCPVGGEVAQ